MNDNRFYVYGLFYRDNNEDNICFYIGKGTGNRCKNHLKDYMKGQNYNKDEKIEFLREQGREPFPIILIDNLPEKLAFKVEKRLLEKDKIFESLTNQIREANLHTSSGYSREFSEQHKQKLSKAKEGKNNSNIDGLSDSHKKSIRKTKIGTKNPASKLTEQEVGEIKYLINNSQFTNRTLAKEYGISEQTICDIKKGRSWDFVEPNNFDS